MRKVGIFCVVAIVACCLGTAAGAQMSSRIFFNSDRNGSDVEIWKSREDGSHPLLIPTDSTGQLDDLRPSLCADGQLVVFQRNFQIFTVDPDGSAPPVFIPGISGFEPDCGPRVNGLGPRRIAYLFDTDPGNPLNGEALFLTDTTGATPIQLTFPVDHDDHDPEWCGDDTIIFSRTEGGDYAYAHRLCRVMLNPDWTPGAEFCYGSLPLQELQFPACNPITIGTETVRIAYSKGPPSLLRRDICTADLNTTGEVCFPTAFDDIHPVWAPSGSLIALLRIETAATTISLS